MRRAHPLCRFAEAPARGGIGFRLAAAFFSRRAGALARLAQSPNAQALLAAATSGDPLAVNSRLGSPLDSLWALEALRQTIDRLMARDRASERSYLETLGLLLAAGARPDWLRSLDTLRTPLARACAENHSSLALTLLPFSDPNATDWRGARPLELCVGAGAGSEPLIESLLNQGARWDLKGPFGLGPLERFAIHGQVAAARLLLARGARLCDPHGASADALAAAACAGFEEGALLLADAGASLHGRASPRGVEALFFESPALRSRIERVGRFEQLAGSPAHWAAFRGQAQLIEICRVSGSELDEPAPFLPSRYGVASAEPGPTPLTLAFVGGSLECASALLQAGASPRAQRPLLSSLTLAEMARRAAGARPPWPPIDPAPSPPLSPDRLQWLWRQAPEFEPVPTAGEIPRELEIIERCVALGASPLELAPLDPNGQDALMIAARAGSSPEALERLLRLGLDPLRRDEHGLGALDHALIDSGFPLEAPLCSETLDALARAVAPLPGGAAAILEAIRRLRDRRPLSLPDACARWELAAAALLERQALESEIASSCAPSRASRARALGP